MSSAAAPRGLSPRATTTVTLLSILAAFCLWSWLTDAPLLARVSRNDVGSRAAFAVRDQEQAALQWVTRSFTWPNLNGAYAAVEYLTIGRDAIDHRSEFVARLTRLLRTHDSVDVFLLAHTNGYDAWASSIAPGLRGRLRLVYNSGCFGVEKEAAWLGLGAKSYVGHVGLSESPVFYVFFLRRWLRGARLDELVADCNGYTARVLDRMATHRHLKFNSMATAESTHAEVGGDRTLAIDGGRR